MKSKLTILGLLLVSIAIYGQQNPIEKKKQEEVTFIVGMHCLACKERIEKAIAMEKGVMDIIVSFEKKEVAVKYNPQKTNPQKIEYAIKELGYGVEEKKNELNPKPE
jgi:copper chaperone CopZ